MKLPVPQWVLNLILKVGLPIIVKVFNLPPETVALIAAILGFVQGSDDKPAAVAAVKTALTTEKTCEGIECHLE